MRTVGVDCVLQSQLIFSHPSFWYFSKGKISLEWKWLKRYFELLWNPALRPHLFLSDGIGRFLFKNRYPSNLYFITAHHNNITSSDDSVQSAGTVGTDSLLIYNSKAINIRENVNAQVITWTMMFDSLSPTAGKGENILDLIPYESTFGLQPVSSTQKYLNLNM